MKSSVVRFNRSVFILQLSGRARAQATQPTSHLELVLVLARINVSVGGGVERLFPRVELWAGLSGVLVSQAMHTKGVILLGSRVLVACNGFT